MSRRSGITHDPYDNEQVRLTTDLLYCPPPSGAVQTVAVNSLVSSRSQVLKINRPPGRSTRPARMLLMFSSASARAKLRDIA